VNLFWLDSIVNITALGMLATNWQKEFPAALGSRVYLSASRRVFRVLREIDVLADCPRSALLVWGGARRIFISTRLPNPYDLTRQ
jgi:hypothetical protein